MIRHLLRKEFQQHGLALVALLLAEAALLSILVLANSLGRSEAGPLDALAPFVSFAGITVALAAGHLLVATEYTGRTQLFLETLPVPRHVPIVVKLALGGAVVAGILGGGTLVCLSLAWATAAPDARMVSIVVARVLGFGVFAWGVCFALSFLGRYRVPCILALLLALVALSSFGGVELSRTGPFPLVDNRTLAYERDTVPWGSLAWAIGLGSAFAASGLGLALLREGSTSALLAERMSQREKGFIALSATAVVVALVAANARKGAKPPEAQYALKLTAEGVEVAVAARAVSDDARALATRVKDDLSGLRTYLGIERLPRVVLMPFATSRTGTADGYRRHSESDDTVDVWLPFPAPGWNEDDFRAWLAREVLLVYTRERAGLERERWLLDGFGPFWSRRGSAGRELGAEPRLLLRALYGSSAGLPALDRWLEYREQVGDAVASAVAWSGLATLARLAGPERVRALLVEQFGRRPAKDARATFRTLAQPLAGRIERTTGVGLPAVLTAWRAALDAERQERQETLAQLPRVSGRVRVEALETARRVRYSVTVEPPPVAGTTVTFQYAEWPLFGGPMRLEELDADRRTLPLVLPEAELPWRPPRRTRLVWTLAVRSEELGCEVISGWHREILP